MRTIFAPATNLFNRQNFVKKLALIAAAFLIPTCLISGVFYYTVQQDVSRVDTMHQQVTRFKPLFDYARQLQIARDLTPSVEHGDKKAIGALQVALSSANSALSSLANYDLGGADPVRQDVQRLLSLHTNLKKKTTADHFPATTDYTDLLHQVVTITENIGLSTDLHIGNDAATSLLGDLLSWRITNFAENLSGVRTTFMRAQAENRAFTPAERIALLSQLDQARLDYGSLRSLLRLLMSKETDLTTALSPVARKATALDPAFTQTAAALASEEIITSDTHALNSLSQAVDAVYSVGSAVQPLLLSAIDAQRERQRLFSYAAVGACSVFVLFALYMLVALYFGIQQSITSLRSRLKQLTARDLRKVVDTKHTDDEIGSLVESTNELALALTEIAGKGLANAGAVHSTSRLIATDTTDLAQRTEQQFDALKLVGERMHDLTGAVRQNVENASTASRLADDAADDAQNGETAMDDVVEAIYRMRDSSVRVDDIVKVIQDIANRTDILAINATIEAARAGEAGRGFSVVANEVRKLSVRSANAAHEIQAIIGEQTQQVELSVNRMHIAKNTLESIVKSTKRVKAIMGAIAASSKEQNDGITRTNESVMLIRGITEQNNDLVESTSRTAKELEHNSLALRGVLGQFKLDDELLPPEEDPILPELRALTPLTEPLPIATSGVAGNIVFNQPEDQGAQHPAGQRTGFEEF